MMFDVGCLMFDVKNGSRCALRTSTFKHQTSNIFPTSTIKHQTSNIPRGISLIEILVSIFVLLFGLMGVAAIFPVGNHYVVEGEKFDLGSGLARNAFEELKARGMLRPEVWLYADHPDANTLGTNLLNPTGFFLKPLPGIGPGHIFVLDPLAAAQFSEREFFPWNANAIPAGGNPWNPSPSAAPNLPGTQWPVRRITLPQTPTMPLSTAVAETIFRLRDDLVVEQPEQDDRPSIQRWNVNGTALLSRQYQGNYSWLATVVPTSGEALVNLQPEAPNRDSQARYDVSVVVFRKREETPSATSERLIEAEMINDGELAIYSTTPTANADVDDAVDDIRPGNWIAVMGVNQTTGDFLMRWYRLLAMDDETSSVTLAGSTPQGRYLMLDGPDWPFTTPASYQNLRVVLMPGVISVATQQMTMEE